MRNAIITSLSIVSIVSVVLFFTFLILSTRSVRSLLFDLWYRAAELAEQSPTAQSLRFAYNILVAFFQNEEGGVSRRFLATAFVLNAGALVSGIHGISSAMLPGQDNDDLANAWCGLIVFAPILFVGWALWDFINFMLVRSLLNMGIRRDAVWPLLMGLGLVLLISYVLPASAVHFLLSSRELVWVPFSATDWLAALYAAITPFMPLKLALSSRESCIGCMLVGLPAGLSVCIPLLFVATGLAIARNDHAIRGVAAVAQRIEALDALRFAKIAFTAFGLATGLLQVVTAR